MNQSKLINSIGNTPLIYLKKASDLSGCKIYGKAEFLNPGESVKDRAALYILNDAIKKNKLKKGGTIVEGTAGNTGIGIALIAKELGIKTVIVIPDTQSQEKKDTLRQLGADLIEVPAVPYDNPNNYVKYAKKVAEDISGYWGNQFDNIINQQAHIETTAEEIWTQTNGEVDGFVCSSGTGGTISGVSIGLKKHNKNIKIAVSDPFGSALYSHFKTGKLTMTGSSITEGIGTSRITENYKGALLDDAFQINDTDAVNIVFDILHDDGLCLGSSSGINVAGAIELGKKMGPDKTIVTILCDVGTRYKSRLFNREFLKSKGLPCPDWIK
jgi:cysteine synthase A